MCFDYGCAERALLLSLACLRIGQWPYPFALSVASKASEVEAPVSFDFGPAGSCRYIPAD